MTVKAVVDAMRGQLNPEPGLLLKSLPVQNVADRYVMSCACEGFEDVSSLHLVRKVPSQTRYDEFVSRPASQFFGLIFGKFRPVRLIKDTPCKGVERVRTPHWPPIVVLCGERSLLNALSAHWTL